jgi:GDP-L-fucose synthase
MSGFSKNCFSLIGKRVWVAGHGGMVGSALVRRLQSENCELLTVARADLDLRVQADVKAWLEAHRPQVIILAAAKVGGILANINAPADFFHDNLMIQNNIIHAAYENGTEKLLFLGSSCIYPKDAPQPIKEEALLSGPLEETNAPYALAKIAGIKMCQAYRAQHGCDFISAMPCNLYGPGDRYDLQGSHVIPALLMKAHVAKLVGAQNFEAWGSGTPLREFMHVDDLADGLVFILKHYSGSMPVNIGSGAEISIRDLAAAVALAAGFKGEIIFDASKPDGVMRKVMDSSRLYGAGWRPRLGLAEGLAGTYRAYAGQEILA